MTESFSLSVNSSLEVPERIWRLGSSFRSQASRVPRIDCCSLNGIVFMRDPNAYGEDSDPGSLSPESHSLVDVKVLAYTLLTRVLHFMGELIA